MSDLKTETGVPEGEKYTPLMLEHLKKTRPWVLFMAIVGIISCSLMVIGAFLTFIGGAFIGSMYRSSYSGSGPSMAVMGAMTVLMGIFYLVFTGVFIPIIVYEFRFAGAIKNLAESGKTEFMESALGHQLSFWKYTGILTIVMIGLAILGIFIALAVSMVTVFQRY